MRTFATAAIIATAISATQTFQDDKKVVTLVPTINGDTLTIDVTSTRTVDDDFTFDNLSDLEIYLGFALSNAVRLDGLSAEDNKFSGGILEASEWAETAIGSWKANNKSSYIG